MRISLACSHSTYVETNPSQPASMLGYFCVCVSGSRILQHDVGLALFGCHIDLFVCVGPIQRALQYSIYYTPVGCMQLRWVLRDIKDKMYFDTCDNQWCTPPRLHIFKIYIRIKWTNMISIGIILVYIIMMKAFFFFSTKPIHWRDLLTLIYCCFGFRVENCLLWHTAHWWRN